MKFIEHDANLELIRLNDAAIASMLAGHGTQTRDASAPEFRDDTAETITQLTEYNAELRAANRILKGEVG